MILSSIRKEDEKTKKLVEHLACLTLAIKQVLVYITEAGASTGEFLDLYHDSDESQIELLSTNYGNLGRYRESLIL